MLDLPEDYKVKQAMGGSDCFFNAVAQGLKQIFPTENFTAESLRKVCHDLAVGNQQIKDKVIKDARSKADLTVPVIDDNALWFVYSYRVRYTSDHMDNMKKELPDLYKSLTSLKYGSTLQVPIQGRPDIEGQMICNKYNIELHVTEKQEAEEKVERVVSTEARTLNSKDPLLNNRIVYILNKGNEYFVYWKSSNSEHNHTLKQPSLINQPNYQNIHKSLASIRDSGSSDEDVFYDACDNFSTDFAINTEHQSSLPKPQQSFNDNYLDLSDLESIPSPSHFKQHTWNSNQSTNRTLLFTIFTRVLGLYNFYKGDLDATKRLSKYEKQHVGEWKELPKKFQIVLGESDTFTTLSKPENEALKPLDNVEQLIESIASSWIKGAPWLTCVALVINKHYRELRKDIREKTNSWSYWQYSERLAYHYYNLGMYHYQVFYDNKVDLESVKRRLEKCLETLRKIEKVENLSDETKKLKSDAENFLTGVNQIYKRQKSLLAKYKVDEISDKERCLQYIKQCLALGDIISSQIFWQQIGQYSDEDMKNLKQQIQSIQLLRIINTLEDEITVSERQKTFITAEQSHYLGQAYHLAGEPTLGKEYEKTAQDLFEKFMISDTSKDSQIDKTQRIRDVIGSEIKEYKNNLEQVKVIIKKTNNMQLSNIDNAYIEQKYIEYCLEFWLQETIDYLKELTKTKSRSVIREIFNSLDTIQNLSQLPAPLNQLKYYQLLMEHHKLISEKEEKTFISKFKKECIEQTIDCIDSTKKEFVFIEAFTNFLSTFKNSQLIIAKLPLENFCSGRLPFKELLNDIIILLNNIKLQTDTYDEKHAVLQEAAECLKEEKALFLIDNFKEVINAYIKPVEIRESRVDGRLAIEVIGKNTVISGILQQLERKLLEKPAIEEVRFAGADILHVDANFDKKDAWHGKNIVIYTKKIKIYDKIKWNVSGKDNNHYYLINAGTTENGHGKSGEDGHAGESGGNVLILAEEIENPENFTIISHGGKGGKGQDGGNGRDGIDGIGIIETDFKAKFPPVAKFKDYKRASEIKKTVQSIKNDLSKIETVWYTGNGNSIEKIIQDAEQIDAKRMRTQVFKENIFIETRTKQGNEITFSFKRGGFRTNCQAFLLYKGSLGQPGGHGGEYGLGGQGGYDGKITVHNPKDENQKFHIIINAKQGEKGEDGKGGLYGSHGINGWDMGYMDYSVSGFLTEKWPKFYGTDQNSKLELEFYSDNSPKRVKCPYRKIRGKKDIYTDIIERKIEQKKERKYEERKNTRQNRELGYHALATRKKNISHASILANSSYRFNSIEKNTLQNLQADLEATKQQALQAMIENDEQQEKLTTEAKVKRRVNFAALYKYKYSRQATIGVPNIIPSETTEQLIEKLQNGSSINDWLTILKSIELSLAQMKQLFPIFEKRMNKKTTKQLNEAVEKLLITKYRFATLKEIAGQLPPYQNIANSPELTAESAARYLIESKENDYNSFHSTLGNLSQYFYENGEDQREKISKLCKEGLRNNNRNYEALKYSLKAFILEVGKLERVHLDGKIRYHNFLEKQERGLIWFPESFNESEFIGYVKYLEEEGPLSASYRELLAYVFDVNIRLYVEDQDGKLSLQSNHNSSSRQVFYILCRNDQFIQLDISKDHLKLEEERKKQDNAYSRILAEVKQFKQKQKFDDYLKKQTFLSNNYYLDQTFYNLYKELIFYNLGEAKDLDEKQYIAQIIEYFTIPEEKQQVKQRLEKITSQYIGQQAILRNISQRFSSEGKHISSQELCYLVKSILTSVIGDKEELNIFCWIVSAYPQKNWIDMLLLRQLENYFRKPLPEKSKWQKYLSKIENKDILLLFKMKLDEHKSRDPISIGCVKSILYLLCSTPNETANVKELALTEWPYALKEIYWTHKLSQLTGCLKYEKLSTASYYLLSLENTFGTSLVDNFIKILEDKKEKLSPEIFTNILSNFYNEKWNLSKQNLPDCEINKWIKKMEAKFLVSSKERDITQLVELIKDNANTSHGVKQSIESICKTGYLDSISKKPISNFTKDDIEKWVKTFGIRLKNTAHKKLYLNEGIRKEMLAIIVRAIELKRGFKLRDTQNLAVLTLITNERNTLAQVSTGEGKSLIVVAASIMKALCGEKVDIITSSSVLAKRDAESEPPKGNKDIYELFGINVSHNCNENIEKRKDAYSCNQVVYGDLSNFQRDYLLDRFYGKNILGDRNFENVIVDEVDSMLLDKGNNMLYLSHDLAGLDKLESVYLYIWQWINRPARNQEEFSYAFDTKAIKEAILDDLYGLIKKEDLTKLDSKLSVQQVNTIRERLTEAKIIDTNGKILKKSVDSDELNNILLPEFKDYKDQLSYLLRERLEREKYIHVPNYLKSFIEQHLEAWINSAKTALFMKEDHDYVVDVDRTDASPDRNPNITILDRDTGTDQANSQWDEALHQFLQLKHGCKLSLQSLKAVFISNVSFFKLYKNLYGLTGTLGSKVERDLLNKIHNVDFVTIPTSKPKQFTEKEPILCTGKEEWIKRICDEAKKVTTEEVKGKRKNVKEKKRSVLIICETVDDVETLCQAFGKTNVHAYKRDYEEFVIAQGNKELEQGEIIIATNLAGRGTDIKITEGLKKAGGLHVCLTYLPNNSRIELQAYGRAGRSGDEGSGQLIIMSSEVEGYSGSKIIDLKKERDSEELHRISDIKNHYETQIKTEENCFEKFKEQYDQLKKNLDKNDVPAEVKEILLQSCLDSWAFWLDRNRKYVKDLTDQQSKRDFDSSLNKFILHLKDLKYDNIETWVHEHPVQMVKLGKYFAQNKKHSEAIDLLNKVIKQEPYFSEAAHYYKAFVLGKKINWQNKSLTRKDKIMELKKELRDAAKLLDYHSKFSMIAAGVISKIKQHNDKSVIQIDAYEKQKESLANLYYMFSQSIDDILGHFVTPQSFVNYNINEELAETLYEDLLVQDIFKKPRIKKNISEEKLRIISSAYGISAKTLRKFLSKYEEKEINKKEFQKMLKKEVLLPSREAFWKLLIVQNVLHKEIKYIIIDNEKLKAIDPSLLKLLAGEKGLQKQSLESSSQIKSKNSSEIFLNAEQIIQQKDNITVFEKAAFKKLIQKEKYEILKKKGVFLFNKRASIDVSKIESITFPYYDSITLQDFNKTNITKNEAEKILTALVEQKIVKQENDNYRLIGQIAHAQLPVHENAVKALLSVCFSYRIALQKIEMHLDSSINLPLMTKPHHSLIFELMEQGIIRPVKVNTKSKDFEKILKGMYSRTMTKSDIINIFSQSKLIPEEKNTDELFRDLVDKKWLVKQNKVTKPNTLLNNENIYSLNDTRQELSSYKTIEETLKQILDNRSQLAKEETIKNIARTLERLRSPLKTLKVPDCFLNPVTDLLTEGQFGNIEEIHIFSLNGLDHLLQLQEKKRTKEMIINTIVVVTMGMIQIAIGATIELYSAGVLTQVGVAFISEGVGDIFFAVSALRSGYFDWKDYGKNKLRSILLTAFSAGIGALFSNGAKVSNFGYKIAGPSFEVSRKKVAEMSGKELIKTVGQASFKDSVKKSLGKQVAKRIATKTITGVVFGLANTGVDMLVQSHLQALCDGIVATILSTIEKEVENNKIFATLENIYNKLGKEEAKKMILDLTNKSLKQKSYIEKWLWITKKINARFIQGIAEEAAKEINKTEKSKFAAKNIGKTIAACTWFETAVLIADIKKMTNNFLGNLEKEINDKLNKTTGNRVTSYNENDCKNFKKEIIDQWKLLLREKAEQVIAQHIVSPILKEGTKCLLRCAGKIIKKGYKSYKGSGYFEQFEEHRQKYQQDLQYVTSDSSDKDLLTDEYHKDLLKLMAKIRNPKLFAAIIRENVPMDLVCVQACTLVIPKILKIPGLSITIEGEGGILQKFSSASEGAQPLSIHLKLEGNHFRSIGENSPSTNTGYDCLFEALAEQKGGLKIKTPEEFRNKIAECIEQDYIMQYTIKQGWHQFSVSPGAFDVNNRHNQISANQLEGKINAKAEEANPYQTTDWTFKPDKDIDLRKNRPLSNKETIAQIAEATDLAINRINEKFAKDNVYADSSKSKKLKANFSNFKATELDTALFTEDLGKVKEGYYPVEMEYGVKGYTDAKTRETFKLQISINNPSEEEYQSGLQGPHGPHIGYKVSIKNNTYVGHILIDKNKNLPGRRHTNIKFKSMQEEDINRITESKGYKEHFTRDMRYMHGLRLNTKTSPKRKKNITIETTIKGSKYLT